MTLATRPLTLLCILTTLLLAALPALAQNTAHPLLGKPAPGFTLPNLEGNPVRLNQLKGQVVILDFWATWCGPCVVAMPELQRLHEKYADQGVTIIGVNLREDRATAQRFVDQHNLTFEFVLDERGRTSKPYSISGIPQTVFIDREGVVQSVHVGFHPTRSPVEYAREIDALLAGKSLVKTAAPEPTDAAKTRTRILEPVNLDALTKQAPIHRTDEARIPAPQPGGWFDHPRTGKTLALIGERNQVIITAQTPEGIKANTLPLNLPADHTLIDFAISPTDNGMALAAATAELDLDGSAIRMHLSAYNNQANASWSADIATGGRTIPDFTLRFAQLSTDDKRHLVILADYSRAEQAGHLRRHAPELDAVINDVGSARLLTIYDFDNGDVVYRGWVPGPSHGAGFHVLPGHDTTPDQLLIANSDGLVPFAIAQPIAAAR
ncbi:MAG: TlpA disulfide reductase family protein [Phycisphaeraceae bacterium]